MPPAPPASWFPGSPLTGGAGPQGLVSTLLPILQGPACEQMMSSPQLVFPTHHEPDTSLSPGAGVCEGGLRPWSNTIDRAEKGGPQRPPALIESCSKECAKWEVRGHISQTSPLPSPAPEMPSSFSSSIESPSCSSSEQT